MRPKSTDRPRSRWLPTTLPRSPWFWLWLGTGAGLTLGGPMTQPVVLGAWLLAGFVGLLVVQGGRGS